MRQFDFTRSANRWGEYVMFPSGEEFFAFVHPLRYKSRMYLERQNLPVGSSVTTKYLYIGPPQYDITALKSNDAIVVSDSYYHVLMAEPVWFHDEIVYYRAILARKIV